MTDPIVIAVKLLGRSDDVQPEPFCINQGVSWRDLRAMLLALYDDCPEDLDVRYEDDEGDMCILSSDDELQEAFRYSLTTANVLQLNVREMDIACDVEEVNVIHVNPHSLFTDAEKEASLCAEKEACLCAEMKLRDGQLTERSVPWSELAETGESAPTHVLDEETGLINTHTEPKAVAVERCEEQLLEVVSHEPVVRKKACYYELLGNDEPVEVDKPVVDEQPGEKQDQESGEVSSGKSSDGDSESMPYQAFVHFMEKLKHELKTEIVHDVTKKTAKQVLKGLDTSWPLVASRKDSRNTHPLYLHEKIMCDKCQKTIIGPRYKCGNCSDFDLCEDCEAKPGCHDIDHVFIKLRRPCLEAGQKDGRKVPLLKHILYSSPEKLSEEQEKLRAKKWAEKMDRRQERMRKREEKVQEKQKKKEEKLKRKLDKLESASSSNRHHPQKREKVETQGFMLPQFKHPYQVLGAEFIRDITIPDFTSVQPGTRMQKTWRLKNTGSHQWSNSTQLRLMWGNISAPKTEVPVPTLPPQEEGDVTVELIAPEEPGKYQSHWKLFHRGVNFGHRVWCSILVEPKEVLEPTRVDQLKMVESVEPQIIPQSGEAKEDEEEDPEERFEEPQAEDPAEEVFLEAVEEKPVSSVIMASKLVPATLIPIKTEPVKITEVKAGLVKVTEVKATDSVGVQVEKSELAESDLLPMTESTAVEGVADLLSFEFLDLGDRKNCKASQTATPNNTPLDVSPPKSPAPEPMIPPTVSNSSSVEVVGSGEGETNLPHLTEYVTKHMASLELKPDTFDEADIESLSSLSSDESDDYCIVPLPNCFNPYLPLTRSEIARLDDNQNELGTQDEEASQESGESRQPSLDEMLTTSGVVATPALDPEPAPENITQGRPLETEPEGRQLQDNTDGETRETARLVDENHNSEEDREQTVPVQSTPSEFVNQLFHTAITAATKAGVKAYSTTKDVFNSMQAKQWKANEIDWTPPKETWTPPKEAWTPPQTEYVPPQSTYTPPEDNYVPPQSEWTGQKSDERPPAPSDPMTKLLEMGFGNRQLNSELLKRFNNDLEPVVQELLSMMDSNWADSRHGNQ